jgi:hypothetical protein
MSRNAAIKKTGRLLYTVILSLAIVLICTKKPVLANRPPPQQFYKMVSTVEYTGQGKYRSEAEAIVAVNRKDISDDKVSYTISSGQFDMRCQQQRQGKQSKEQGLSFVYDRKTREISECPKSLVPIQVKCNSCIPSLTNITAENIGKTWKQEYEEICFGGQCYSDMKFTVTAKTFQTEQLGEMIAVRALSEPVTLTVNPEEEKKQNIKLRANTFYLFDADMERVYLSISAFEQTTSINGYKEKVRYETAAYLADAQGNSIDLTGLDKKFAKFVRKVGLVRKELKIEEGEEIPLPAWVHSSDVGITSVQTCNMAAALACEGAANPVVLVFMPVNQALQAQSLGAFGVAGGSGTVGVAVVRDVVGMEGLSVVVPATIFGVSHGAAASMAGIGMGTTALVGNVGNEGWGGKAGGGGDGAATRVVTEIQE